MLNERQQAVVSSSEPYKSIVAGAGSGKTHTLVELIKADVERGMAIENMVVMTFTRNASIEIKERLEKNGIDHKAMFAGTIHQFCLEIIKRFHAKLKITVRFDIFQTDDKEDIMKHIIKHYGYKATFTKGSLKGDAGEISRVKAAYNDILKQFNAVDFDLILSHVTDLMADEEVKEYVNGKYKHFYVDEFQDTNTIQFSVIQAMAPESLTVIGDPDQSIYEWNGAEPEILININEVYPAMEQHKLVDNYRSTHPIITAANNLIRHNFNRVDKDLIAHKGGEPVEIERHANLQSESNAIANIIKNHPDRSIAVICRKNAHAVNIHEALILNGLKPNLMLSSASIVKSPGIQSIVKLMSVVNNDSNEFNLARALNFVYEQINALELMNDTTPLKSSYIMKYGGMMNIDFFDKMDSIRTDHQFNDALDVYKAVIDEFKIVGRYMDKYRQSRITELYKFERFISKWQKNQLYFGYEPSLSNFLRYLKLMDVQDLKDKTQSNIDIMTVHGSKGLEYDVVIVACFTDKDMPNKASANQEEERRIAYVAVTRAKEQLYLTNHMKEVTMYNVTLTKIDSKFIKEMGLN